MLDKVYKKIELVGVSEKSIEDAVSCAIAKASETIRNIDWFEISEVRGYVKDQKPVFQVVVKIGFRLEEDDD